MLPIPSLAPLKLSRNLQEVREFWESDLPLVSVLISTYNHADFIENALDGVLMQTFRFPFEIIVRDDGSTDSTAEKIKKYTDAFPGIVKAELVPQNFYALKRPELELISQEKGEFIAWCDGDVTCPLF